MNKSVKHKFWAGIAVVLVIGLLLPGCAPKPAPAPGAAPTPAAPPIKMRYSGPLPPDHDISIQMKWFGEEVKKRTGGRVTVETYVAGELYDYYASIEAVTAGSLEMAMAGPGHFAGRSPIFSYQNLFFLVESVDHWKRAQPEIDKLFEPLFAAQKIKPLNWFWYGESGLITKTPVNAVKDIKGLRIRGSSKGVNDAINALGGVGTTLAVAEAYDAMAKGALDGILSGWSGSYTRKWYEVAKYFTGPTWRVVFFGFMNLDTWNKLPKDIQETMTKVAKETEDRSFKAGVAFDIESLDALAKYGTVKIFTPEETRVWAAASKPDWDRWVKDCDGKGQGELARRILKIFEQAR